MRLFLTAVVVLGAALWPVGSGATASGSGTANVVVSLHGSIVVFSADGSSQTVVTRSGQDHAPVMAPDGSTLAFWRGTFTPVHVTNRRVMVARWNGRGGWRVAQFSLRSASADGWQQTLEWAPGSHALAWFEGAAVEYRHVAGPQRAVLHAGPGIPTYGDDGLAFSRDGGTLAASLPMSGTRPPRTLRVTVRKLRAARQRTIAITFRPGVLNGRGVRGSVPVGEGLAYTTSQLAARGHTLQIATIATGAGQQLTGIFLAPDSGGRARLVQGNGHGLHGIPPFGFGMDGATHFEDAPNGRYLATDPSGGFYVAGEVGPFHLSAPTPAGCVLAQWTWLSDSVHLAYVTECTVPGGSPIHYRLILSTISIHGGTPIVLYRTIASDPNALDLAPTSRCLACG